MDNPYTPESGAVPRDLVGRDVVRTRFAALLDGLERGHAQRSHILTGVRGTGKTVMLRDHVRTARARRWAIVDIDAARRDDHGFRRQLAFEARSSLLAVSPRSKWTSEATTASGVLGSFASLLGGDSPLTSEWTESAPGSADSGALSPDVTALLLALGEAARSHSTGIVFVIDELQRFTTGQLGALIDGLHRTYLRELPITLVGAGLPRSDALFAETQVRANRLFEFSSLDAFIDSDTATLLRWTSECDDDAIAVAQTLTGGYPRLVQALGHVLWEKHGPQKVTADAVEYASAEYEKFVDEGFFREHLSRAGDMDIAYLRAVVDSPIEAETARLLERTTAQCAETRSALIDRGLIHLSESGSAAFTTPHFEGFIRRTLPTLSTPPHKQRRRRYDP
ncbi:AAA family ATPase [Rhodococcus sp. P1Y]|uniref:AAA family ATPase n=1 Tax=Rhodococcus sp. P1Y TaxID=1302308 RepID=UPI000EB0880A|nr:AAA family ATPase [Rhodococcus sp. P1Y]AYJ47654.1 ATP-binding protein [Rhodococcus sp. P1Y]